MTGPPHPQEPPGDGNADDLGAPIESLALLDYPPSPGFLRKVRGRIQRRVLGRQVADFGWTAPRLVFMAFLEMLFGAFRRDRREKGDKGGT